MAITATGVFTVAGISALRDLIYSEGEDHFLYVALGEGDTAATVNDTALEAEVHREAVTATASAAKQITFSKAISITGAYSLNEVGIFNDSVAGDLLWRGVFDTEAETASGDTVPFELVVTLAGAANSLTTAGLNEVRNLLGDLSTPSGFTYLAYGTGTGAESASDTALGAEVDREQCTGDEKVTWTTFASNDTLRLWKIFTASSSGTIGEVGIFNASTGGDMLARSLLSSENRDVYSPGSKIIVVYDITPYG